MMFRYFSVVLIAGVLPFAAFSARSQDDVSDSRERRGGRREIPSAGEIGKRLPNMKAIMEQISPEEREEMMELQQDNPEEFRRRLHGLIRDAHRRNRKNNEKIRELTTQYYQVEDSGKKAEIKEQIHAEVKAEFEQKMELNKKKIEQTRERLEDIEKQYNERMQKAEQIIDERVRSLTVDPDLRW